MNGRGELNNQINQTYEVCVCLEAVLPQLSLDEDVTAETVDIEESWGRVVADHLVDNVTLFEITQVSNGTNHSLWTLPLYLLLLFVVDLLGAGCDSVMFRIFNANI